MVKVEHDAQLYSLGISPKNLESKSIRSRPITPLDFQYRLIDDDWLASHKGSYSGLPLYIG